MAATSIAGSSVHFDNKVVEAPARLHRLRSGMSQGTAASFEPENQRSMFHRSARKTVMLAGVVADHFGQKTLIKGSQIFAMSVFPKAMVITGPCAILAGAITFFAQTTTEMSGDNSPLRDVAAWTAFSTLLGFLIVFRTSQAYTRFWEGCTACHAMRAEWFDACSALIAFCTGSVAGRRKTKLFQHVLVRVFSMMHAAALAEMEDRQGGRTLDDIEAYSYQVIDVKDFDEESLRVLMGCQHKVELLYQWLQVLIMENVNSEVLCAPAPILTRAFQEIANGMVAFHEATKISQVPFPLPYTQACDMMLAIHWLFTPLVMSQWVHHFGWAIAFTFIQVFILWSLNLTAKEIENPFGRDANDLNRRQMQADMNEKLKLLIAGFSKRVPQMKTEAILDKSATIESSMPQGPDEDYSTIRGLVDRLSVPSSSYFHSHMHQSADAMQRGISADVSGGSESPRRRPSTGSYISYNSANTPASTGSSDAAGLESADLPHPVSLGSTKEIVRGSFHTAIRAMRSRDSNFAVGAGDGQEVSHADREQANSSDPDEELYRERGLAIAHLTMPSVGEAHERRIRFEPGAEELISEEVRPAVLDDPQQGELDTI